MCRLPRPILPASKNMSPSGGDPSHVASVASFFVSRIDSAVDKQLDEKIAKANDPTEKERLAALKGKVAIANAKLAYQEYKRLFSGARWDKLAAKGAKPQRLLWASTGTKNKDYSDVLYVEELIGPNTVNTVPPATLDAFRDHGKLRDSLEENVEDAGHVLAELEKSGISLDAITAELVKDGVKQFADAADKLYGAVAHKRATVLGGRHRPADAGARRRPRARRSRRAPKNGARRPRSAGSGSTTNRSGPATTRTNGWAGSTSAGGGRYRRLRGFRAPGEGTELHRCRRARHGRIEPRAGGAGADLRQAARLPETACAGFHRSGAGPRHAGLDQPRRHAVHRLQQVRRHHRAERDEGLFLRARRRRRSAPTRPAIASSP